MIALMELFLVPAVRTLGVGLVGQAVGFFILRKLGVHSGEAMGLVLSLGGVGVTIFILQLFHKNLSWVMGLPFSKRQLIAFHYATNALTLALVGLSQLALGAVLCKLALGPEEINEIRKAVHELGGNSLQGVEIGAALWMVALFYHHFCLSVFQKPVHAIRLAQIRRWKLWTVAITGVTLIAAELGLGNYFNDLIVVVCSLIVVLNVVPIFQVLHAFAIHAAQARRYQVVAGALAVVQCLVLIGWAEHDKNSGDASKMGQAVEMLGSFRGTIRDASLVEALASDTSPMDLDDLAKIYREQHSQGLTIQSAIASKKSDAQIAAVLAAFDPKDVRLPELLPLFVWLEHSPKEFTPNAKTALFRFIKTPMEAQQTAVILDTPSHVAHEFALVHARYFRAPDLQEVIVARLAKLSPEDHAAAIDTLAILRGGKPAGDRARAVASSFYAEPDCSSLKTQVQEGGSPSSEGFLNVCLRKAALERGPSWVRALESQGWVSLPLNDAMRGWSKSLLSPPKGPL